MKKFVLFAALLLPISANADCGLHPDGTCMRDRSGNSVITSENLGGGYNSHRNGVLESQTRQTIDNSWEKIYNDGSTEKYQSDPYINHYKQH